MSRKDLAAWKFVNFPLTLLFFCQFKNREAILTSAFLGAAFLAKLECGAAGEALAFWAFAEGLDIGKFITFCAKLGGSKICQDKK